MIGVVYHASDSHCPAADGLMGTQGQRHGARPHGNHRTHREGIGGMRIKSSDRIGGSRHARRNRVTAPIFINVVTGRSRHWIPGHHRCSSRRRRLVRCTAACGTTARCTGACGASAGGVAACCTAARCAAACGAMVIMIIARWATARGGIGG